MLLRSSGDVAIAMGIAARALAGLPKITGT
jgi:hypothetical protein